MSPSSLRKYRYDEVSLSSNFSKPIATPEPVTQQGEDIFAGFSFSSPLKEEFSADVNKRDDPYEQIELTNRKNIIPQPAPRRLLTKPQEHIYSDVSEVDSDTVTLNDSDTIVFDHEHECDSGTVTSDMVANVEEARFVKQLGARPKNTMTMDIRRKISEWYEEAEKEVERDLSLDISQLEIRKIRAKSVPVDHSYDPSVYTVTRGGGGSEKSSYTQKPTMTLLRTFDPCFDKIEKEAVIEERDEKNSSDEDEEKNHAVYEECDNLYAKIDELKESSPSRNIASPQTTVSPRKTNIGPPKPPRSFNHPTTSGTEPEEKLSPSKKGLKSRISEGNLFRRSPRGDEKGSSVPDSASEGSENIYVTAPVWNIADAVSDNSSDALSGEISLMT